MAERTSSGNPDGAHRREADAPALLQAARRGEGDAWAALVSLYARRVYAFARSKRLDAHQAEEITQSVFATVSIKVQRGEYDERGSFEAWLFQIAANRVRDFIRKSRRGAAAMDALRLGADEGRGTASGGDDGFDDAEVAALRRALCALPEPDREGVELRHHAGLSFKHIAAMLEQPLGTVLARHHRALRKLKDLLDAPAPREREDTRP